jgi:hypothetical protein
MNTKAKGSWRERQARKILELAGNVQYSKKRRTRMVKFFPERASYRLTLKEHPGGTPYFLLEPKDRELSIVEQPGWLALELRPGMTYKQAEGVWKTLATIIDGLSYGALKECPDPD